MIFRALFTLGMLGHAQIALAQVASLAAPVGSSGGQIDNTTAQITAHVTTGHAIGGGVSDTVATVQEKGGYPGQLFDPLSLIVQAAAASVNEDATLLINANAALDDATLLVPASGPTVNWATVSGPVAGIDADGFVTPGAVLANTPATVQGTFFGLTDDTTFTVLDSNPDNFESYAADGMADNWQISFFGMPPNANAGPTADPDADLRNNLFEFLTGYKPDDPSDRLEFKLIEATGTSTTFRLSKIIPGTRYRLEKTSDLEITDPLSDVVNITTATEVIDYQMTDNSARPKDYYRLTVEPE